MEYTISVNVSILTDDKQKKNQKKKKNKMKPHETDQTTNQIQIY